ncbi:hypothetical protein [Nocardiopsis lucentensis]|uniref:hypothetical protein n=1 Tax=Nocardiopsis lucentensis TaxID=53441 RepID=UPI00034761F3|nr:hypothetical protein [Nocardiopsis lucentensis]
MITVTIILTAVTAYLWYGFTKVAPAFIAREVAEFIDQYPELADEPNRVAIERREKAGLSIVPALIWPIYLATRALTGHLADRAPRTDHELHQQLEISQHRIAELERELGIEESP